MNNRKVLNIILDASCLGINCHICFKIKYTHISLFYPIVFWISFFINQYFKIAFWNNLRSPKILNYAESLYLFGRIQLCKEADSVIIGFCPVISNCSWISYYNLTDLPHCHFLMSHKPIFFLKKYDNRISNLSS